MGNKKSKFAALFQEYPDVVSVPQLCKMLGVCKGNAYQLLHSGQIKYLRVGQVYRIPKLCVIDSQSSKSCLGLVDAKPVSEFVPSIYPELWKAISEYNRGLYESGQEGIHSLRNLEESCFTMSSYGVESDAFGVLSIPALELEMPIYLGASSYNMSLGAAQLGQTSIPIGGVNTNSVIAGHRGWNGADYFRYIPNLVIGDKIQITNLWGTLEYTVTGTKIISPNDVEAIKIQPGKDMITLFTCHPYASGGRQRYLVFCERTTTD